MREIPFPGSLRAFTLLHDGGSGEGLPEDLVAALALVLVGLLTRGSVASSLARDELGYNTGCIPWRPRSP